MQAFNIMCCSAKLLHSLRFASFGVATAPAASHLRALKGSRNPHYVLRPSSPAKSVVVRAWSGA